MDHSSFDLQPRQHQHQHQQWSRRSFLTAAASGAIGFSALAAAETLPRTLVPSAARRARHVIFVHLVGGPSQIDTWDPKPEASSDVRNFAPACETSVPGVQISEQLPLMAQRMHLVSLVRTLHHDGPATHAAGQQQLMTGTSFFHNNVAPHWGSVVSFLRPSTGVVPTNVVLGDPLINEYSVTEDAQDSAWLSAGHRPCFIGESTEGNVSSRERLALDLQGESWPTRARYGFHDLGRKCLHARQLIEQGTSIVTINQFSTVMDQTTWDMHSNGGRLNSSAADYRDTLCPQLDQALSGLLDDLSDRGLLAETVVAVSGEMGRSPLINAHGGRDHHPGCWSGLLAGGPLRAGEVIGKSDALGGTPDSRPVSPAEFLATLYQALGIPAAATLIPGPRNVAVPALQAHPIWELF